MVGEGKSGAGCWQGLTGAEVTRQRRNGLRVEEGTCVGRGFNRENMLAWQGGGSD